MKICIPQKSIYDYQKAVKNIPGIPQNSSYRIDKQFRRKKDDE